MHALKISCTHAVANNGEGCMTLQCSGGYMCWREMSERARDLHNLHFRDLSGSGSRHRLDYRRERHWDSLHCLYQGRPHGNDLSHSRYPACHTWFVCTCSSANVRDAWSRKLVYACEHKLEGETSGIDSVGCGARGCCQQRTPSREWAGALCDIWYGVVGYVCNVSKG